MRLGLLIYGSLNNLSGGYLYDRMLVKYLRNQGDQVQVISLPWRNYLSHLGDNLSASLLWRLSTLEIDILLQDELNHPSLFWLNRRLPYPIVSIVHHLRQSEQRPAWQNQLYRWVERNYLTSVDGFIYNSRTTQNEVERLIGSGCPGLVAYPAGDQLKPCISEDEIAQRASRSGPLRVLFLGNVIHRKGLHTLLRAVSQMPPGTCSLTVIGSLEVDWAYAARMQGLAAQLDLSSRVSFLGALADDKLGAHLERSHVLVVPSSYEGFGIAYLEGMGFGLPAIATTAGAAKELITHQVDGYLIEPEDTSSLTRHLNELHENRTELVSMSLAAQRRFSRHLTWEQGGMQIRSFLLQMRAI